MLSDGLHRSPFVEWIPMESFRVHRSKRKSSSKPKLRQAQYM